MTIAEEEFWKDFQLKEEREAASSKNIKRSNIVIGILFTLLIITYIIVKK